jgi:hypothetical protein
MAEEAAAQKQAAAAINGERCSSFSERSSGGDPGSPSQRRLMMLAQTKAKKSNSLSKGVNGVQRSSLLEETLRAATIKNHPLNKGPSLVFNSNRVLPETMNVDAIVAAALKEEEESTAAPPPDDSTTGVTDAIVAAALKEEEECTATPPPDDSIPSAGPLTEAFQVAPGTAEESTPPSDSKQQAKEEPDRASRRSSFNGAKDMASLGLASTRQFAATSLRKYSTSRRVVLGVIESAAFENAVLLVILLNTASLAMDHHQMSKDLEDSLELANYVFSGVRGVCSTPARPFAVSCRPARARASPDALNSPHRASQTAAPPDGGGVSRRADLRSGDVFEDLRPRRPRVRGRQVQRF